MSPSVATVPSPALRNPRRPWLPFVLLLAAVWAWAVAGCLDEWRNDPMYSYGWFVPPLMLFFLWRRLDEPAAGREPFGPPAVPGFPRLVALGALFLALFVLPAELLRNELPDDRLNNWAIAGLAVAITLGYARAVGGWGLVRSVAFPIAFFLTAVAWPKRYEEPVTLGLQGFVTGVILEVLHFLGIHAVARGNTLHLDNGPVGIAEACSGIRSLQASLMISLAVGELFFLRFHRRVLLVVLAAGAATLLNLARTLALCLFMDRGGTEAMHKAHDTVGNTAILLLPLAVWALGLLLERWGGALPTAPLPRRPGSDGSPPPRPYWKRLVDQARGLAWERLPRLTPALLVGVAGFLTYHVWLAVLDFRDPPQRSPFFSVRTGPDTGMVELKADPEILATLAPTSGGVYSRKDPATGAGMVSLYHFFWKPAAANRWVTGHRPDICMPSGGWKKDGDVEPVDIVLNGHTVRMYQFRFTDGTSRALQFWGIWRNGQPIRMEFFDHPTLEWSLLEGRSRSAVEIVSCVVTYADGPAPVEVAKRTLSEALDFQPAWGPRRLDSAGLTTSPPHP